MTVARKLSIKTVSASDYLMMEPVSELNKIAEKPLSIGKITVDGSYDLTSKIDTSKGLYRLKFKSENLEDFSVVLANADGEEFVVGYDQKTNRFYTDRTKSGLVNFENDFARISYAPRIATGKSIQIDLLIDRTSAELFADGGLTCMTTIFFPKKPYQKLALKSSKNFILEHLSIENLHSIWPK